MGKKDFRVTLFVLVLAGAPVAAQNYSVPIQVTAAGGSTATGGTDTLSASIGQPVATSAASSGGTYALLGGFWHTTDAVKIAVPFIDPVLTPGVSVIRLIHVMELRQRIDALRARYSLAPYGWTDPTLIAGATLVRAAHFTDLRNALSQAYVAVGLPPPTYASGIGAGVTITAAGIAELRAAVIALE